MSDTHIPETLTAHQCESCGQRWTLEDLVPVYECSSCSGRSDERRCAECHKFMARDGEGCPDCFDTCEPVKAVVDLDGSLIDPDDYDPSMSLADRDKEAAEAARRAAEERVAAQLKAHQGRATVTAWANVTTGMVLAPTTTEHGVAKTITVVHVATREDGMVVAATVEWGQVEVSVHHPRDTVAVLPDKPEDQWGGMVRVDAAPHNASSPARTINIRLAVATRRLPPVMSLTIVGGNMGWRIAEWFDPTHAAADLDLLEQAARDLCSARGEVCDPAAGAAKVTVKPSQLVDLSATPHPLAITIGIDPWMEHYGPLVNFQNRSQNASLVDGSVLAAAVAAARANLDHLTMESPVEEPA